MDEEAKDELIEEPPERKGDLDEYMERAVKSMRDGE
jgi:hypothetical protein